MFIMILIILFVILYTSTWEKNVNGIGRVCVGAALAFSITDKVIFRFGMYRNLKEIFIN